MMTDYTKDVLWWAFGCVFNIITALGVLALFFYMMDMDASWVGASLGVIVTTLALRGFQFPKARNYNTTWTKRRGQVITSRRNGSVNIQASGDATIRVDGKVITNEPELPPEEKLRRDLNKSLLDD